MRYQEVRSLIEALMAEAGVNLNEDVERAVEATQVARQYEMSETGDEGEGAEECEGGKDSGVFQWGEEDDDDLDLDDDVSLQWDTEEALTEALLVFFESLPEATQAELSHAIRRFAVAPKTEKDLAAWQQGFEEKL